MDEYINEAKVWVIALRQDVDQQQTFLAIATLASIHLWSVPIADLHFQVETICCVQETRQL
jgi:hypothetical protein